MTRKQQPWSPLSALGVAVVLLFLLVFWAALAYVVTLLVS